MRKIKGTMVGGLSLIIICIICSLIMPQSKDAFLGILCVLWETIKAFFLQDAVKKVLLYLLIAILTTGTCIGLSKRKEKKIWLFAGAIADVVGLIVLFV